jgi:hypothetical protein
VDESNGLGYLQGGTLPPHTLVEKLLADPDNPVESVILEGYIGTTQKQGYTRLYLDLEFQSYLEIPPGAIILVEPVDQAQISSKTIVVVKADAKLEIVQIARASFLKGNIVTLYLENKTLMKEILQNKTHPQTPACPPPPSPI